MQGEYMEPEDDLVKKEDVKSVLKMQGEYIELEDYLVKKEDNKSVSAWN